MSQVAGGGADGCGIAGGENGGDGKVCYFVYILKWTCLTHQPGSHTYEKGRIGSFGFQSQAVPTLPSLLLFIHEIISLVPVPFSKLPHVLCAECSKARWKESYRYGQEQTSGRQIKEKRCLLERKGAPLGGVVEEGQRCQDGRNGAVARRSA